MRVPCASDKAGKWNGGRIRKGKAFASLRRAETASSQATLPTDRTVGVGHDAATCVVSRPLLLIAQRHYLTAEGA